MEIRWNEEKNASLQKDRGISFERVLVGILNNEVLDIIDNKNTVKYPGQKLFILNIDNYAYVVPFKIDKKGDLELITIYPSRKFTKMFKLKGKLL